MAECFECGRAAGPNKNYCSDDCYGRHYLHHGLPFAARKVFEEMEAYMVRLNVEVGQERERAKEAEKECKAWEAHYKALHARAADAYARGCREERERVISALWPTNTPR